MAGCTIKEVPLHIDLERLAMKGTGLIVTVTVKEDPPQLPAAPDIGVTVYVAVCATLVGLIKVPLILVWLVPVAPPVTPPVTVGTDQE